MKKILCAALAVIMVLGLAACGKTETPTPTVPTYVDGVAVENGTEIIDNVPMVKGSVIGVEKEYLTIAEVQEYGYTVSYKDEQMTISKIQDIEGNLNNDVNVEDPNASTDVIGGNDKDAEVEDTTTVPEDTDVKDPVVSGSDKETTGNGTNTEATTPAEKEETTTPPVVVEPKPEDTTPKEDTPAHTHKYTDKVVAPTCEKGGYTVHTCDCGHSYSDKETKATGHSYTDKVVAPTTSAQGYTLHTCGKCGASYKDTYTDKLPAEKPADPKPSNPGNGDFESDGWKPDDYGSDEVVIGNSDVAGQFTDHKQIARPVYNSGMSLDAARQELNGYIGQVYSLRFFSDGISLNDADDGKFAKFVKHEDGRLGINVFGWRKSYGSNGATNASLNCVLEAFAYLCGDRDVAYALWSAVDYLNINGGSISNDKLEAMGFSLSNETARSIEMTMNGTHIYWEWPAGTTSNIFYFG